MAVLSPPQLHEDYSSSLSVCTKKSVRILKGISVSLKTSLESTAVLKQNQAFGNVNAGIAPSHQVSIPLSNVASVPVLHPLSTP